MSNGVFDKRLTEAIRNSRVLMIGAGGVGCEILKNLVLSGFPKIEVIDLDTIEVTNLNRQFLFRKEHVGKSKAIVAKDSALQFNPDVEIIAHHDTIFNKEYGLSYFKQFNLVINALDNRKARNHVNRICLAADIPLIETGTAGYAGQVELIKKGVVQCYECTPTKGEKNYPSCTIRNTPSQPIHCIVWAKHLFNQLFGHADGDENVSPDASDPAAGSDKTDESKTETKIVNTRQWAAQTGYNPEKLFTKLFSEDIYYLLSMSNLWKDRNPPKPLSWKEIMETDVSESNEETVLFDHRNWTIRECVKVFTESVKALKERLSTQSDGELVWDKDNKEDMYFVAASANIRSYIFNIDPKTCFEIKSMAGNIIPAIATANAIIAGLAVLRAQTILKNELFKCTSVFMRTKPNHIGRVIVSEKTLIPPNPNCHVCSVKPSVDFICNLNEITLKQFQSALLENLHVQEPDIYIDGAGIIILSSEPGETDGNLGKTLKALDLADGSLLLVEDFSQNYELRVRIINDEGSDSWKFIRHGDPKEFGNKEEQNPTNNSTSMEETSDIEIVDEDDDSELNPPKRRRVE